MNIPKFGSLTLVLLTLTSLFLGLPSRSSAGGIAVFWGQNGNEGTLHETCNSGLYTYVVMGYLYSFGNGQTPQLNLAGHCDPSSGGCQQMSHSIRLCQSQGIKVLLSLGGGAGNYSLSSNDDAKDVADYLWNNFLGGTSKERPLGNAILDGIDLDIATGTGLGTSYYATLAIRLSKHSQDSGRKVYLAAAPQCPFPDVGLDKVISTGLIDFVWIQFYNNPPCDFDAENPDSFKQAWMQWTSKTKANKFFVGLPADANAAISGFVPSQTIINQVLPFVKVSGQKYGGVMLWSRFYDLQSNISSHIGASV